MVEALQPGSLLNEDPIETKRHGRGVDRHIDDEVAPGAGLGQTDIRP